MTYYLFFFEDGTFGSFLDEQDPRVNVETMINITEEVWTQLQIGRCLFLVNILIAEYGKLYENVEDIFIPIQEIRRTEQISHEPNEIDYLIDLDFRISLIELGI